MVPAGPYATSAWSSRRPSGASCNAALIGGLLAIIPLFLFLRRLRMTLIITMAIPTSLLITMALHLLLSGSSLNILSMLGITIAIGMLVDNSIVVVENIFRLPPGGARRRPRPRSTAPPEVALAVTLATLTTVDGVPTT